MDLMLWVRQICGFLILSAILKNLLSQKNYGPYVKLFMNLLLVLLLAGPLVRIDLSRADGLLQQVSAYTEELGWKQELSRLAGDGQGAGEQVLEAFRGQLDRILSEKGYEAADVSLEYGEEEREIRKICLTVKKKEGAVQEPVILRGQEAYTGKEREKGLEDFLREKLDLSEDVELSVTLERT